MQRKAFLIILFLIILRKYRRLTYDNRIGKVASVSRRKLTSCLYRLGSPGFSPGGRRVKAKDWSPALFESSKEWGATLEF